MNRLLTLLAAVVSIGASAQTLQAEYFVDTDPGFGKAIHFTVPTDADGSGTKQLTIPATLLPAGRHLIGVRIFKEVADGSGKKVRRYSPTVMERIDIFQPADRKPLSYLEYFWDTDPGYGKGTHMALPASFEASIDKLKIPTGGLAPGRHRLGVRIRGGEGWSPTYMDIVEVWPVELFGSVRLMEYFWDVDPGFGKATQVKLPAGAEASIDNLHISTTDLAPGIHRLGVRFSGGLGWSPTLVEDVVVLSAEDYGKVLKMEYFWDVDPGYGNGTPLNIEPGTEVTLENVIIPLPGDGQDHKLGLRGFGNNKWGPTFIYDTSTPPRYVDESDLAALKALYNATNGAQWSGAQWSTNLTEIRADNWSGVSFNSEDRVSAIDLHARSLSGNLQEALPALPEMTSLNLSQNALKGDPAKFVSNNQQLTALDLSYNQLDELTAPLSLNLSDKTLNLSYQHRVYKSTYNWPGLNDVKTSELNIGKRMDVNLPVIAFYNHAKQSLTSHPKLTVYNPADYSSYGTLTWQESNASYAFSSSQTVLKADDGSSVILQPVSGTTLVGSAYPGILRFTLGDANLNGFVDVNDVQRTLNYILDTSNNGSFGLWAANTYSEGETTTVINIQDIVCTVNIVLENETSSASRAMSRAMGADSNLFYAEGREIKLDAMDDIAAFDLEIEGVNADQVKLMLNANDWQMATRQTANGVRLLVFSPTGAKLEAGSVRTLLKLGAQGIPVAVQATSPSATSVNAAVSGSASTGIQEITTTELQASVKAGQICLVSSTYCGKTTVHVCNAQGLQLGQYLLTELRPGENFIDGGLPLKTDLIIVTVRNEEIGTKNYKLMINN